MSIDNQKYIDKGFKNRDEYLESLSDEYGIEGDFLDALSDVLGEDEDFDGLVSIAKDAESYLGRMEDNDE